MDDLTVLFVTASEMPEHWREFHIGRLFGVVGDTPMVVVNRVPCEYGEGVTHLLDEEPKSYWNIYVQMLRAAKEADTPYVAMVEDDTLYPRQHFTEFRPRLDAVSYNRARWSLFTWDTIYCMRQRISNCSLIAGREYLIDALEERCAKWPEGPPSVRMVGEVGRPGIERKLGVTRRRCFEWYSTVPVVQLNHPDGTDGGQRARNKRHGAVKAIEIPHWGKAADIVRIYHGA